MIVVDASALIDLLLVRSAHELIADTLAGEQVVHAPHLIDTEVLHALRRRSARGWLAVERAQAALDDLGALPLMHHPHAPLRRRIWELRNVLTAYNATYVALAEGLQATLLTADAPLARAAAGLVKTLDASG